MSSSAPQLFSAPHSRRIFSTAAASYRVHHRAHHTANMSAKARDFHDLSQDEDDGSRSNSSSAVEDSRFSAIPNKRRRVADDAEGHASSASNTDDDKEQEESNKGGKRGKAAKVKPVTHAQLEESRRKAKKSGVIYISRVPPFMKPTTVRNLLSPYGTIGRIFLTPESAPSYIKRVKSGGNKKRSFLDGWVEFASKKDAKACVELLNGNIIGGKKGGFYHDDLWNIKYLTGFKWSDLMEQAQLEEKMQEGQMRAELLQDARERNAFLKNLERSKMEKTRTAKRQKNDSASETHPAAGGEQKTSLPDENGDLKARFADLDRSAMGRKMRKAPGEGHVEGLKAMLF